MLQENALILEHVTLSLSIEGLIKVPIDLFVVTVPAQQATEDTLALNPESLRRHTSLPGTAALTVTAVAAEALSCMARTNTTARRALDVQLCNDL